MVMRTEIPTFRLASSFPISFATVLLHLVALGAGTGAFHVMWLRPVKGTEIEVIITEKEEKEAAKRGICGVRPSLPYSSLSSLRSIL
ncbi:hypothetical protein GGS23DRAFT_306755 [Durotheca rogersii]|uniref:uncharacterized protein n=1 Tax=Durotheca rogersii TaxID=419775 RepID=UPI00222040AE|nr:uncharacterized protein GGS23DRAFT_306755 [Durotheca rogersii]KAI5867113.1 hypothetical protein GGS23DRAFT_306755 [Durotheca rogersii]